MSPALAFDPLSWTTAAATAKAKLTPGQLDALEAIEAGPLFRVANGWRRSGGRRFSLDTISGLRAAGAAHQRAGRQTGVPLIEITDLGREVLKLKRGKA